MDLELVGKKALVTGGASNIGRGIVRVLAREGATIGILDIDKAAAERAAEDVRKEFSVPVEVVGADITDREATKSAIADLRARLGGIDILVQAAGGPQGNGTFLERDPAQQDRELQVNLVGAMNVVYATLPDMVEKRSGRVVLIGSESARKVALEHAAYSMAKAGVLQMTRVLALDLAPLGITVNAVNPMFTVPDSDNDYGTMSRWATTGKDYWTAERRASAISGIPLGRAGTPEEIGDACAFLVSPRSSFVTGQVWGINGGGVMC